MWRYCATSSRINSLPKVDHLALVIQIAAWFAYFVYGNRLNRRAMDCIEDPSRRSSVLALLNASALGPHGLRLRRRALIFWLVGGAALVGLLYMIGTLDS
jgi:hypothetical protein